MNYDEIKTVVKSFAYGSLILCRDRITPLTTLVPEFLRQLFRKSVRKGCLPTWNSLFQKTKQHTNRVNTSCEKLFPDIGYMLVQGSDTLTVDVRSVLCQFDRMFVDREDVDAASKIGGVDKVVIDVDAF